MNYIIPQLSGETGNMYFEFYDGKKSKIFHSAKSLDAQNGTFEIKLLNDETQYMDLLGNFSQKPTEFASALYDYISFENYNHLVYRSLKYVYFKTALVNFPSKFLINKDVLNFIVEFEWKRYQTLIENNRFVSLIEKASYKHFILKNIKAKLKRMKRLSKDEKLVKLIYEQTTSFQ